jgi:RHS repeat-associated protein
VSSNGNSVAGKKGFNGVELEESFGLDLYEMDLRQYDPAIARWTGIDPVTHHSMSPYVAFDNNPVFWKDTSGRITEKECLQIAVQEKNLQLQKILI